MSQIQLPKTSQSQSVTQVQQAKQPTDTTQKLTQTDAGTKSSLYGPKLKPINPGQHTDFDNTQQVLNTAIDKVDAKKIGVNSTHVPKPSFFQSVTTMFQGVFPKSGSQDKVIEMKEEKLAKQYETMTFEKDKEIYLIKDKKVAQRLSDTLGLTVHVPKLHNWQIVIEENSGLADGVECLHKALCNIPPDVKKILDEKRGKGLLVALINHPWIKSTLAESIMVSDIKTGYFSDKKDYHPAIFGYGGNCNHTSFMMKYMLLKLAEKTEDPGTKEMFGKLDKAGDNKHTYLKYEVSPGQSFCLDPTIRQFQMNTNEYKIKFENLSNERKAKISECKMIYWGPSQEHLKEIKYLDARNL